MFYGVFDGHGLFTDRYINKNPKKLQSLKDTFLKTFKVKDKELRVYNNIYLFCSGTTLVALITHVWYEKVYSFVFEDLKLIVNDFLFVVLGS